MSLEKPTMGLGAFVQWSPDLYYRSQLKCLTWLKTVHKILQKYSTSQEWQPSFRWKFLFHGMLTWEQLWLWRKNNLSAKMVKSMSKKIGLEKQNVKALHRNWYDAQHKLNNKHQPACFTWKLVSRKLQKDSVISKNVQSYSEVQRSARQCVESFF